MAATFKLDAAYLKQVGLDTLPAAEANVLLTYVYETLEMRVGTALAHEMTNRQLDEFQTLVGSGDDAGALKWLETNFPDYRDVVGEELERLTGELASAASLMLTLVGSDG